MYIEVVALPRQPHCQGPTWPRRKFALSRGETTMTSEWLGRQAAARSIARERRDWRRT